MYPEVPRGKKNTEIYRGRITIETLCFLLDQRSKKASHGEDFFVFKRETDEERKKRFLFKRRAPKG